MVNTRIDNAKAHDEEIAVMNACINDIEKLGKPGQSSRESWIEEHVPFNEIDIGSIRAGHIEIIPVVYKNRDFTINTNSGRLESDFGCGISMGGGNEFYWASQKIAETTAEMSTLGAYLERIQKVGEKAILDRIPNADIYDFNIYSMYDDFYDRKGEGIDKNDDRFDAFEQDVKDNLESYCISVGIDEKYRSELKGTLHSSTPDIDR